ncbi:Formin-like protein 20 [Astathelohania contejeani]|uniref:Formin-like protein 20 n=1 Tax=Astathelohania contejeani TaxID=164912 RepID=A0ABQ7I036_9MICR|nr:Formin-like protein 20 [Thelohania contejeani]
MENEELISDINEQFIQIMNEMSIPPEKQFELLNTLPATSKMSMIISGKTNHEKELLIKEYMLVLRREHNLRSIIGMKVILSYSNARFIDMFRACRGCTILSHLVAKSSKIFFNYLCELVAVIIKGGFVREKDFPPEFMDTFVNRYVAGVSEQNSISIIKFPSPSFYDILEYFVALDPTAAALVLFKKTRDKGTPLNTILQEILKLKYINTELEFIVPLIKQNQLILKYCLGVINFYSLIEKKEVSPRTKDIIKLIESAEISMEDDMYMKDVRILVDVMLQTDEFRGIYNIIEQNKALLEKIKHLESENLRLKLASMEVRDVSEKNKKEYIKKEILGKEEDKKEAIEKENSKKQSEEYKKVSVKKDAIEKEKEDNKKKIEKEMIVKKDKEEIVKKEDNLQNKDDNNIPSNQTTIKNNNQSSKGDKKPASSRSKLPPRKAPLKGPPKKNQGNSELEKYSKFKYNNLRWNKVSIEEGIWNKMDFKGLDNIYPPEDFIPFQKIDKPIAPPKKQIRNVAPQIFPVKKGNALNIALSRTKESSVECKKHILALETGFLNETQVDQLIKQFPTSSEMEQISLLDNTPSIGKAEAFFKLWTDDPNLLMACLEAIRFKQIFYTQNKFLLANQNLLVKFYTRIIGSKHLKEFFRRALFIGNILNNGNHLGNASAFTLDSFFKFMEFKGADKKSLLDFIVLKFPEKTALAEDLSLVEDVLRINLDGIFEEYKVIEEMYNKISKCCYPEIVNGISNYKKDFINLKESIALLKEKYKEFCTYFGVTMKEPELNILLNLLRSLK